MPDIIVRFDLRFTRRAVSGALAAAMVLAAAAELNSEAVTLTTFYPAPSGVYTKMITTGDTYLARDGGKVGIGTGAAAPQDALHLANGNSFRWANNSSLSSDQGGGIELGGDAATAGTGTPYIDFHYYKKRQDYNVRLINDADGVLTVGGQLKITGGSPGDGKVLTSDSAGKASWESPSTDFKIVKGVISITAEDYGGSNEGCTVQLVSSICNVTKTWRTGGEWDRTRCISVASNEALDDDYGTSMFCGHRPALYWGTGTTGTVYFFTPP